MFPGSKAAILLSIIAVLSKELIVEARFSNLRVNYTEPDADRDLLSIKAYFVDPKTISQKYLDLQDRHVVFCFVQPPQNSSYKKFEVEPIVALIKENLRYLSPKWMVHAVTDSEISIRALSNIKGLQVVDMRNIRPSERFLQFKATYIPQSQSDIEYEAFCMWRWIVISDYFNELKQKGHPVNFIVSLDTDVLLLDDPLTVDRQMEWSTMESYRIVNGAAVIWNLPGIDSFANFLVDSYSTREKAAELVLKHGTRASCREDKSLLIECFFEEGDNTNLLMVHMSDMYWYFAWMQQNTKVRFTNRVRDGGGAKGMDCYVTESLCDRSIRFIRRGVDVYENSETQTKKFCVLHFQGWSKIFVSPFLSFLEGSSTEYFLNISNI